jgi:hypothetical protein
MIKELFVFAGILLIVYGIAYIELFSVPELAKL